EEIPLRDEPRHVVQHLAVFDQRLLKGVVFERRRVDDHEAFAVGLLLPARLFVKVFARPARAVKDEDDGRLSVGGQVRRTVDYDLAHDALDAEADSSLPDVIITYGFTPVAGRKRERQTDDGQQIQNGFHLLSPSLVTALSCQMSARRPQAAGRRLPGRR